MSSDEIKAMLTMREVVQRYGFKIRNGFITCPFHNDSSPSMKVYKHNVHCYSCGADADVFGFVMQVEKCDFKTAFTILGGTYSEDKKTLQRAKERALRIQEERKARQEKERIDRIEKADSFKKKYLSIMADMITYKELTEDAIPGSDAFWEYLDKYHVALNRHYNLMGGADSC